MPNLRDHRVVAVGLALTDAAGMGVDVGHHFQALAAAEIPDDVHLRAVEQDCTPQGLRVDIIVRQERFDRPETVDAAPEKEAAAFAMTTAALTQQRQRVEPQTPAAVQVPPWGD